MLAAADASPSSGTRPTENRTLARRAESADCARAANKRHARVTKIHRVETILGDGSEMIVARRDDEEGRTEHLSLQTLA